MLGRKSGREGNSMAQPFTPEQREAIRARLVASARRHALDTGFKKTSLDMLTAEAGISKSSFYKFFDNKEMLFLEIAGQWESQVISAAMASLAAAQGRSDKERAAAMVLTAFETIYKLGIIRFLCEDLPQVVSAVPEDIAREHYLSSAQRIFSALHQAQIHFTVPEDIACSVIKIMYLSILHINEIGETFFAALRELVVSACDRLVA